MLDMVARLRKRPADGQRPVRLRVGKEETEHANADGALGVMRAALRRINRETHAQSAFKSTASRTTTTSIPEGPESREESADSGDEAADISDTVPARHSCPGGAAGKSFDSNPSTRYDAASVARTSYTSWQS